MSQATLNSLRSSLDTAIAAGSYASALILAERIEALLVVMPDSNKGEFGLRWMRGAGAKLRAHLTRQAALAVDGGMQHTKIDLIRPTAST